MTDAPIEGLDPFQGLVLSLAAAALTQLGAGPPDAERHQDLAQARQTIDLLEMLQQKTKGNLTDEETQVLDSLLFDVRMRYLAARPQPPSPHKSGAS